jgi:hypothetical protein
VIDPFTALKARAFKTGFDDSSVAEFSHSPLRLHSMRILDFFGDNSFCWNTTAGKQYQVEFSCEMTTWYPLGPALNGVEGQLCLTNWQMLPVGQTRFLRVRSLQP